MVDAKDYRIICILEVYSQNKNEDDFLESLELLMQVMKEEKRVAEGGIEDELDQFERDND